MFKLYRCKKCGNLVWKLYDAGPDTVCCGEPMELLGENSVDAAVEKHVPVITRKGEEITVSVGSVAHPMEDKHFIGVVAVAAGGVTQVKTLKAGETPQAVFKSVASPCKAYAWCNLHGLWTAKE